MVWWFFVVVVFDGVGGKKQNVLCSARSLELFNSLSTGIHVVDSEPVVAHCIFNSCATFLK